MRRVLMASAAFLAFGPSVVQAQSAEPAVTDLGEVVVTAQRRSESLQKAALSVTALSGEDLREQGKSRLSDIIQSAPGVQISGNPRGPAIFIRGVGTDRPPQFGDAPIAVNVDGLYLSRPEGLRGAFYDVERVEVLRGPQGTLYGRNATGGGVNVITAQPTDVYEGRGSVEVGTYDLLRTEGMINVPVSEDLAVRAAFATESREGFLSNGGADAGVKSGRIKTLWRPSDTVRLSVQADYTKIEGKGVSYVDAYVKNRDDAWKTSLPSDIHENNRLYTIQSQLDVDLPFATLTVLPGYRDFERKARTYVSGNYTLETSADQQTSLEGRLSSPSGGKLAWTLGAYYLRADQPVSTLTEATREGQNTTKARTDSYAGFGQATLSVTDRLRLTAGARYTQDDKSARAVTVSTGANNGVVATATKDSGSFDYKLGVEWDAGPRSLVYAQVATGYKNGGFNALPRTLVTYEPETLKSVQIGAKNRFFDNRLQVNAEAFHYRYEDYQTVEFRYIAVINNFAPVTINADSAKLYGAEVETVFAPSAKDRLEVSVAFLETKFGPFISGGVNYTGYPLQRSPKWTIPVAYQHVFDLGGGSLTARADVTYKSSSHTNFAQTAGTDDPAHYIGNAYLTFTPAEGRWTLGGYVKNIGDYAELLQVATGRATTVLIGNPRTAGVILSAKF